MNSRPSRCVVLGAGAPHQGEEPALLEPVNGMSVFNWLLNAIALPENCVDLVLGYHSDDIARKFPGIRSVVNKEWETTGSVASLLQVDLEGISDLLVCYGDILFRSQLVEELRQQKAPVVVAWDSKWRQRYINRDLDDLACSEKVVVGKKEVRRLGSDIPSAWASGEFIGLVWFNDEALDFLRQLKKDTPQTLRRSHLSGLVEWLRSKDLDVLGFDVAGDWAEVNQSRDIAHFVLGTKADTLARLSGMISSAVILDQVSFSIAHWERNPDEILKTARDKFGDSPLIVRSSARSEDGFSNSNAGAYTSLLNVDGQSALEEAIREVIESYFNAGSEDQVLIQPMLKDVVLSGVAFTRTLEHGAPWYVVNFEQSGGTDGITSGNNNDNQTLYVRKDSPKEYIADKRLVSLITSLKEIEDLLAYDALDVEFAVNASGQVHVLQVRPIAVKQTRSSAMDERIFESMRHAETKLETMDPPLPHLVGQGPIYGIMPDWNPAEIIGTHPSCLAESLYRYLILDEVWAIQRAEFGYRDVRPHPLLVNFAGKPYIDVRASFNSFVPASIPDQLADRLVTFYLDRLRRNPHLHDKVEFDVLPTCLGLNYELWKNRLVEEAGFTESEVDCLKTGLREITSCAIERTRVDNETIHRLAERFDAIIKRSSACHTSLISKAKILLDDCRLFGTLPFAHLARSAFVAVTLLKDAVSAGAISETAREEFMMAVRTVSHEMNEDSKAVSVGVMKWENFVEKFGHLRPGTYDLVSPAYRDNPEKYLRPIVHASSEDNAPAHSTDCWDKEKSGFFDAVRTQGLNYSDRQIERFLFDAIEGRETAKFIFTRNLSTALDIFSQWGEEWGLTREEISNLALNDVFNFRESGEVHGEPIDSLRQLSRRGATRREIAVACELPPLICGKNDLYSFLLQQGQPNYVGSGRILADCIDLTNIDYNSAQPVVAGCIVLIPQADPGYDWLFGQDIGGLVTMYGGANSHMAIRAAEFGLPAAIGIGEQLYRKLVGASVLELDAANRQLKILH